MIEVFKAEKPQRYQPKRMNLARESSVLPWMKPNLRLSRRQFTRTLFTGAGAVLAAPAILRGQNLNDKINIAIIGSGGRGGAHLSSVSTENIVALCDVNANNLEAAAKKHPTAKKYSDFR